MKHLTALLIFCSFITEAGAIHSNLPTSGIDASKLKPVAETNFRVLGRGIRNSKTGDSIALVCAHIDSLYGHPLSNPCNAMRFIYFKAGNTNAYYLSDKLIPGRYLQYENRVFWGVNPDQVSFNEQNTDALIEHSVKVLIKKLSFKAAHAKMTSNAIVDRNGWNWSANPVPVHSTYFDQLTRDIRFLYNLQSFRNEPQAEIILLNE